MNKEMTAEEYYLSVFGNDDISEGNLLEYGDLRAKEAVKEFAEELIAMNEQYPITMLDIRDIAKQKGVEI